jgi:hypothetical protein
MTTKTDHDPAGRVSQCGGGGDLFHDAGWEVSSFSTIEEHVVGNRAEYLERLRLRTFSTFEQLTAEEIAAGFDRLEEAVAADPDAPLPPSRATLLTLIRP